MKRIINYFSARELLSASLVLLAALFIFFSPQLFSGGYFAPADIIRALNGPFVNGFKSHNSLLSDVLVQFIPWFKLSREMIAAGDMPLWNIYSGGGLPLMANMQSQVFWPLSIFIYLFNFKAGLYLYAAGKLFLTGFFTYLFLREIRVSKAVSLVGSIAFMFAGFNVVWLMWPHTNAVFLLPLGFYLLERYFRAPEVRHLLWFSLAFAIGLFGGHPETFFHIIVAVAFYAIYKILFTELSLKNRVKHAFAWVASCVLGSGLAAVLLLPFGEYLNLSQALADRTGHVNLYFLPKFAAILNFIPDLLGNPAVRDRYYGYGANVNYNETTMGYVGIALLLFALYAAIWHWREKLVAFFVFLVAFSFAMSYHAPGLFALVTKLPGFDAAANHRLMLIFGFGVVVLGSIALQKMLEGKMARLKIFLASVIFGVIALLLFSYTRSLTGEFILAGRSLDKAGIWQLLLGSIFVVGFVAISLTLWLAPKRHRIWLIGLIVFAETGLHGAIYNTSTSTENFYPSVPATEYLAREFPNGYYKTFAEGVMFAPNLGSWYGFNQINDNDAVGIKTYTPLKKQIGNYTGNWEVFNETPNLKALAFLGAKYLAFHPSSAEKINQPDFEIGFKDQSVTIFTQPALPRAYFIKAESVNQLDTVMESLLLNPDPDLVQATDSYELKKNGSAIIEIQTESSGFLVMSENYFPGWTAVVNGSKKPIEEAMGLRVLSLDAGQNSIRTYYLPKSFIFGLGISLASLFVWLALLVFYWKKDLITKLLQNQRLLKDMVRFGLVGVVAGVVDLGLLNILYVGVGLNIYLATFWAFVTAVVVAYLMNNHWTYKRLNLPFRSANLFKYAVIGSVGLAITEGIIYLLVTGEGINHNLAKIIAIMVVFFWNFFINRLWTFRPN